MNAAQNEDEVHMQEILEKVEDGGAIRTLAKQYDRSRSTIRGRRDGATDAHSAQIKAQKLSPLQEQLLADYLLEEEALGRALSLAEIRDVAHEIIDPGGDDNTIGRHWTVTYIAHCDVLIHSIIKHTPWTYPRPLDCGC
ncbi:hypothetical protein B0J13DRAFT_631285 [Dactylonectria estremocensis]|uniref:HTH CENPB-type domain-containing protein n=1 Tax=Dactylonectria estremocensis TaxID=1079267 RepID=A0A9P9D5W5_9HYPO|nr:hypothetical protein B0J13DRAFT_631285 [Dactylonectria estremocensis]